MPHGHDTREAHVCLATGSGGWECAGECAGESTGESTGEWQREPARRWLVVTVLVAVVLVDQAGKWWGWRHAPVAQINAGGDALVGSTVGAWYAAPLPGALLDLVGALVLGLALRALLRPSQPVAIQLSGAVTVSGWSSNLLDRLGLHRLSAPGSMRGAVDFIQIGENLYNIADFVIGAGTLVFLAALAVRYVAQAPGPAPAPLDRPEPGRRYRLTSRRAVATVVALSLVVVLVIVGAHHRAPPGCRIPAGGVDRATAGAAADPSACRDP